jgi:hypothetical protein
MGFDPMVCRLQRSLTPDIPNRRQPQTGFALTLNIVTVNTGATIPRK